MDGSLDDPIWQLAKPITDFRQREPFEGQRATEATEVRILYTHKDVYFGIVCHDSTPHGVIASQLRRDVSQEFDDHFEIIIDSRRDRRNAYLFQINPLGTQRDGLLSDESQMDNSQDGDPGWDGVWTSEARITDDGWTATVEIPFSTLNFMRSQDVVWGVNFKRFIRRKNEEDLVERMAANVWHQQDQRSGGTQRDQPDWQRAAVYREAVCARRIQPSSGKRGEQRLEAGHERAAYRRARYQVWAAVQPGRQSYRQHGFRRQRCGCAAVQSDSLQIIFSREAAVFSGERQRVFVPHEYWGERRSAIFQPADRDRPGYRPGGSDQWRRTRHRSAGWI